MRLFRLPRSLVQAALVAAGLFLSVPASAQESPPPTTEIRLEPISLTAASLRGDVQIPAPQRPPIFTAPVFNTPEPPDRPGALMPLYGSLIALQGLDIHSTRRALGSGGSEANPAMRPVVKNSAAFVAVKAGATAGVIWASEKLWKKNRKAAVIFASVVNVAMAAVVANNYRVGR
jgi:hypothetical protein